MEERDFDLERKSNARKHTNARAPDPHPRKEWRTKRENPRPSPLTFNEPKSQKPPIKEEKLILTEDKETHGKSPDKRPKLNRTKKSENSSKNHTVREIDCAAKNILKY